MSLVWRVVRFCNKSKKGVSGELEGTLKSL